MLLQDVINPSAIFLATTTFASTCARTHLLLHTAYFMNIMYYRRTNKLSIFYHLATNALLDYRIIIIIQMVHNTSWFDSYSY